MRYRRFETNIKIISYKYCMHVHQFLGASISFPSAVKSKVSTLIDSPTSLLILSPIRTNIRMLRAQSAVVCSTTICMSGSRSPPIITAATTSLDLITSSLSCHHHNPVCTLLLTLYVHELHHSIKMGPTAACSRSNLTWTASVGNPRKSCYSRGHVTT